MGFLNDFTFYNSGNECPRDFWIWSGLSLLGHIVGRKVWFNHGRFPIYPALYVGLFGSPGSGKSTAKGEVKRIIIKEFPELLTSASIQSREDIIDLMLDDTCARSWQDPFTGEIKDFRPFYIIANEFEAFLSVNPSGMIQFLVDVHDEESYGKGFKKDRNNGKASILTNPYVSILSCGIPDWLMRELKVSMFSGGLGRRLIIVCAEPDKPVDRPYWPVGWEPARARVIEHLHEAYFLKGEVKETELAKKWWTEWYYKHKADKPLDPILGQFHSTKHVMVQKVATLLSLDERPFKMVITDEHYGVALAMFDALAPRIEELTIGVGRNQIAGFTGQLLEMLRTLGGCTSGRRLRFTTYRDAPGGMKGYQEALKHLQETKQVFMATPDTGRETDRYEEFVFLPPAWVEYSRDPQKFMERFLKKTTGE